MVEIPDKITPTITNQGARGVEFDVVCCVEACVSDGSDRVGVEPEFDVALGSGRSTQEVAGRERLG